MPDETRRHLCWWYGERHDFGPAYTIPDYAMLQNCQKCPRRKVIGWVGDTAVSKSMFGLSVEAQRDIRQRREMDKLRRRIEQLEAGPDA